MKITPRLLTMQARQRWTAHRKYRGGLGIASPDRLKVNEINFLISVRADFRDKLLPRFTGVNEAEKHIRPMEPLRL